MTLFAANILPQWESIPDERVWLEKNYLPTCSGSMLYIGVGSYTTCYPYYTQTPSLFETIDYLEERAKFGSPFKHHVADILHFQPNHLYDNVSFFGILGYTNKRSIPLTTSDSIYFTTNESIYQVLEKIHSLVKVGGTLQIGANYYDKEPYTVDFWLQKFDEHYAVKYKTVSVVLSPLSVIWLGKKLRD